MTAAPASALQRDPGEGAALGVAYYRVSTSRQANTSFDEDGFSIQAQRDYCQRKAAEVGVQLVDEYIDRGESARTANRPALQTMLARIKDDTAIQYVFVHKLDRLARSREDDVQIGLLLAKNGVTLVSCTENIDNTPSGKLVRGIMADINEWYSANLGQEVWKGMRKKVEHGGTPGYAPIGYQNVRVKITELGKDIGAVRVDETLGPVVTECFKLYDSGRCTLVDVAAYANDQGLRLRANKLLPDRPMTRQAMQKLLRNRYYIGWVTFGGVEYQGTHLPLIDAATFDRVQALLTARNTYRDKNRKRPHHLKGFLFCAQCGRRLGICVPLKRRTGMTYPYFYCLGRQADKRSCQQGYMPIGDVEDAVRAYWARVHISAAHRRALHQATLASFAGQHDQGQVEIERQRRRLIALEQRGKKAKAAYYADVLTLDELKAEQTEVRNGIQAAEASIAEHSVELASIQQTLDMVLALTESPQALYDALPEALKGMLIAAVFTKLWLLDARVMGSELTDTFADLLTLEARLAMTEQHRTLDDGATDADESVTHFREREAASLLLRNWDSPWERPVVERPYGQLPIDSKNRGLVRDHGSNFIHLVHLTRLNLNSDLVRYLEEHPVATLRQPASTPAAASYRRPPWHVRDRLSDRDVVRMILAFQTGIATTELARHYNIDVRGVRKLLREHGMKTQSRRNTSA